MIETVAALLPISTNI